jgi:hypothetical protein
VVYLLRNTYHVGVLGFDRYVRCRVAGRGRQLASLNICHKKTSQ